MLFCYTKFHFSKSFCCVSKKKHGVTWIIYTFIDIVKISTMKREKEIEKPKIWFMMEMVSKSKNKCLENLT